jgi:hypothetical protein
MRTTIRLFLLFTFGILSVNVPVHSQDQKISFIPQWDTIRVLKNPYKGWYHHLLDNGISNYKIKNDSVFASFPGMDHLYLRLAWSYLEPKEGKYDWSYIDKVVEKYVPKGYKISFRISCSETGKYPSSVGEEVDSVQYATPSWVEKAGAKGTIVTLGRGRTKIWVPKWGDPVFLEKLDNFHRAFASRYDGKSWVRYIDVGSIGDWGEGHTSSSIKVPPTFSEVKANIDIYLKNYKKSQLTVCDDLLYYGKPKDEVQELYQYAVSKGISLRDDSPLVDWYIKTKLSTWSVSHPQFYDPLYLKKPIVFELEHYRLVKSNGNWLGKNGADKIAQYGYSGAEIMRNAIKTLHATYIGYHGYAEDWLAENPDLTKELANLCGYWYFPVRAIIPGKIVKGENSISIDWLNKGIAPAYNIYGLILRFEAANPDNSFELVLENSGNTNWLPGKIQVEKYLFSIPSKAVKGQYKLNFKLVDQKSDEKSDIQLGLIEKAIGNKGFIYLGNVVL